jgi:hypothetical protein
MVKTVPRLKLLVSSRERLNLQQSGFCQGARLGCVALNHYPVQEWVLHLLCLWAYPKELMLRHHMQVESSRNSERDEGFADSVPTRFKVARESPEKCICSWGETVIECQLALQSVLAEDIIENLRNMQARSASTDVFSIVTARATCAEEFCRSTS